MQTYRDLQDRYKLYSIEEGYIYNIPKNGSNIHSIFYNIFDCTNYYVIRRDAKFPGSSSIKSYVQGIIGIEINDTGITGIRYSFITIEFYNV